ncbi:unnamed protein product [Rotaria magnacalcarata]|uniref:Uncharacterized protein n=1 Tax=Rotaria magnacalcarata TaxID=392030 RepID=A0A815QU14_9BILA|nr:unnamed protein product [Rotaria magnacalcarata]
MNLVALGVCLSMIIADGGNDRIIRFRMGDTRGQVIARGHGERKKLDQLNSPSDVLVVQNSNSLIICDRQNRRVLRCYFHNNQRYLYISNDNKLGGQHGTLVTGGHGQGSSINQLNESIYLFVDQHQNLYILDNETHCVMKWNKDAKEEIIVAGGHDKGNTLRQLSHPEEFFVDTLGNIYVADSLNHRVMRWSKRTIEDTVVVGGNGKRKEANQFNLSTKLSLSHKKYKKDPMSKKH